MAQRNVAAGDQGHGKISGANIAGETSRFYDDLLGPTAAAACVQDGEGHIQAALGLHVRVLNAHVMEVGGGAHELHQRVQANGRVDFGKIRKILAGIGQENLGDWGRLLLRFGEGEHRLHAPKRLVDAAKLIVENIIRRREQCDASRILQRKQGLVRVES